MNYGSINPLEDRPHHTVTGDAWGFVSPVHTISRLIAPLSFNVTSSDQTIEFWKSSL
jgi:hypothetical protein